MCTDGTAFCKVRQLVALPNFDFPPANLYSKAAVMVVAHNIRSLHNVGAILRSAAAFGVEQVYLTGITATPPRQEIAKVSLGAEDLVPWARHENIADLLSELRKQGYSILGLETGEGAQNISSITHEKITLVLGNEVEGIDGETRKLLDGLVEIPMDKKRSLNVSVAAGIAMFVLSLRP